MTQKSRKATPITTTELCSKGCMQQARYINKSGNLLCDDWPSKCPKMKELNSRGQLEAYKSGRRVSGTVRYDQLPQEVKDRMNWRKGDFSTTIFEYGGGGNHKRVLILERGHKCQKCGLSDWLEQPITLELEHIDGDHKNNVKENLLILCPNCHSQTSTWKGKNMVKKKAQEYVTDEELTEALLANKNVRQALMAVGLSGKGGNYARAYDLLHQANS